METNKRPSKGSKLGAVRQPFPPDQYGQSPGPTFPASMPNMQHGQHFPTGPQMYGAPPYPPQVFDDTSGMYYGQPPMGVPGAWENQPNYDFSGYVPPQLLADPMANLAMQYGQTIAGQGTQIIQSKVERFVLMSNLKYYFAVDTSYVCKKLGLLILPFKHTDWTVHYDSNQPVAPRLDVNVPDLYIPVMAFVTYILIAGYFLGVQNRFSPEHLGMLASSAMGWIVLEVIVMLLALYIMNMSGTLSILDLASFSGYKFVCMIGMLLLSVVLGWIGYYSLLGFFSISLSYFLLKTIRVRILPQRTTEAHISGNRRSFYLLLAFCFLQCFLMYYMTKHLVFYTESVN